MSDELGDLKQDYRAIAAPPGLSARVMAEIQEQGAGTYWRPRYLAAAAMLLLALPLLFESSDPEPLAGSPVPSLSRLAPKPPAGSLISMGSLRSVSLPAIPARPVSNPYKPDEQQIEQDTQSLKQSAIEENFHENA